METNIEKLMSSPTLAPLKEFYEPQNLNVNDKALLANIAKGSVAAIESSIGTLTHLLQNLKIYKDCMIQSINLQAESADMTTKYARDIPQQSNILPGIVSTPSSYDLGAIRSDNERMMQIKNSKDKLQSQKDLYLRIASEDVRLFISSWKRLNISNASFDEFILALNSNLNDNY